MNKKYLAALKGIAERGGHEAVVTGFGSDRTVHIMLTDRESGMIAEVFQSRCRATGELNPVRLRWDAAPLTSNAPALAGIVFVLGHLYLELERLGSIVLDVVLVASGLLERTA